MCDNIQCNIPAPIDTIFFNAPQNSTVETSVESSVRKYGLSNNKATCLATSKSLDATRSNMKYDIIMMKRISYKKYYHYYVDTKWYYL